MRSDPPVCRAESDQVASLRVKVIEHLGLVDVGLRIIVELFHFGGNISAFWSFAAVG
jgi:hypothetical protein